MSEIVPVEGAERFYRGQYLQPHPTATEGTVDHADTQEAVDGKAKHDDVRVSEQERTETKAPIARLERFDRPAQRIIILPVLVSSGLLGHIRGISASLQLSFRAPRPPGPRSQRP